MNNEFPIKLITRNSTIKDIGLAFFVAALVAFFIFYLSMSPSCGSSAELKVFWFIEGVPLWVKEFSLYGLLFFLAFLVVEFLNRKRKKGLLVINNDEIVVSAGKKITRLEYNQLKEIAIVTGMSYLRNGSTNMKVILKTKKDTIIRVKLLFDVMIEEIVECLNIAVSKDIKVIIEPVDPYWPE